MTETIPELLNFLIDIAYLAGRKTLAYYQTGVQADYKSDRTPVTMADREAEKLIRERIEGKYPLHAIVGEEFGDQGGRKARYRWIVDPIDGTKSFLRGIPLYAVLIGLEIDGYPAAGAAYFPALDEMIYAADGMGCWWNGRPARVSDVSSLDGAWITCTDPAGFARHGKGPAWERMLAAGYVHGGWSDAYGYLLVATGRAEIMLDPVMEIWDCGPFVPILREAGGYFGDWKGNETIYGREGLATNAHLKQAAIDVLHG